MFPFPDSQRFLHWFSKLCRWTKEERDNISPTEPRIDLIQENKRLRKENRLLREEREILKKPQCSSPSKRHEV
jgi:transposase